MFTKFNVKGLRTNAKSKTAFSITTGNHFRLTRKPNATAFMKPGRKSKPKNIGAFALMPMNVPIITLAPPRYGPRMMTYMGARLSAIEKAPPVPMIGYVGIIR